MSKRGQITLFLLMGMLILLLFGVFLIVGKQAPEQVDGRQDVMAVEQLVDSCLSKALVNSERLGFRAETKPLQEQLVKADVKKCADFSLFAARGIDVKSGEPEATLSVSDNVFSVLLNYPITVHAAGGKSSIDIFRQELRRSLVVMLDYGLTGVKETRIIVMDDKLAELMISPETFVAKDGSVISSVGLAVIDKHFEGKDNDAVIGELAYQVNPEGADVYPPITLSLFYDKKQVRSDAVLSLAFFDYNSKSWVSVQSTVDKDKGAVSAKIKKFQKYAIINCPSCSSKISPLVPKPTEKPGEKIVAKGNACSGVAGSAGFMSCPLHVDPVIITGSFGSGNPRGEHCNPSSGYDIPCDPNTQPHWGRAIDIAAVDGQDVYDVFLPSVNGEIVEWEFDHQDPSIQADWGWVKFFTTQTAKGSYLLRITHMEKDNPSFTPGEKAVSGTRIGKMIPDLDGPGIGHIHASAEKDGLIVSNPEFDLNLCSSPREQPDCI